MARILRAMFDDATPEDFAAVSPLLGELAALIGKDALARLVASRGGTRFSVPKRMPKPSHWLASIIVDRDALAALVWMFAGCQIILPTGEHLRRRLRHRDTLTEGSANSAALAAGVHIRTIYRRRARQRRAS